MARTHKPSDPNLIECYCGPSGRKLVEAVRRSGQILKLGTIIGHVRPGLTVSELVTMYEATNHYKHVTVTLHGASLAGPVVTQAKADAREKARIRRVQLETDKTAAEHALLAEHGIEAYVSGCLRREKSPRVPGEPRYLYDMARFNAGKTGGYLGTAIGAKYHLGAGTTPERIAELDTLADRIADATYGKGANLVASRLWSHAFYGR